MTKTSDICLPTLLSVRIFGRPEDREWTEPIGKNNDPVPTTILVVNLEQDRLSA